jgi:KaiC/GvpD/RAD55 family RecA-like ATPase
MIPSIETGIPGFDGLSSSGGIPENTVTLIYGPPKTGKSIFSYQFACQGLPNEEPCLYLATDYVMEDLKQNMMEFGLELESYLENNIFYVINAITADQEGQMAESELYRSESELYQYSSLKNPIDVMVKVGEVASLIYKKNPRFRAVLDSLTTLLLYNENMLIVRVLKAYIMRIKAAGGTAIINYTEGSTDSYKETMIKSMADNIIRLDGEYMTIEAMKGMGKQRAAYNITDKGMVIGSGIL